MKRTAIYLLIIMAIFGLLGAWASIPYLYGPYNLSRFKHKYLEEKVRYILKEVMGLKEGFVIKHSSAPSEKELFGEVETRLGLKKGVDVLSHRIPFRAWTYSVVEKGNGEMAYDKKNRLLSMEPFMALTFDNLGGLCEFQVSQKGVKAASGFTQSEAETKAMEFLQTLSVNIDKIHLTKHEYNAGEMSHNLKYEGEEDFGFVASYEVDIKGTKIIRFSKNHEPAQQSKIGFIKGEFSTILKLLSLTVWAFFFLLLIITFFQKLRRDEIDYNHAGRISILCGSTAFIIFLFTGSTPILIKFLLSIFFGVLIFCLTWLLFSVCESQLRTISEESLSISDVLFSGGWKIKDIGRGIFLAFLIALSFQITYSFLSIYIAALPDAHIGIWRGLSTLGGQPNSLSTCASLFSSALGKGILGGLFFIGVLHPFLSIRFSKVIKHIIFTLLFSLAMLPFLPFYPSILSFMVGIFYGLFLSILAEHLDLLVILLSISLATLPPPILACFSAEEPIFFFGGVYSSLILLSILLFGTFLYFSGNPILEAMKYQPPYLLRMREKERFLRELEIAKRIQDGFLPKVLPAIPNYSMIATCQSAMEVGGDYYDFFKLSDGRLGIALGDVSGKGVGAAFYMTLVKGILNVLVPHIEEPREVMCQLNSHLKPHLEKGVFLTLVYLVFNSNDGSVRLCKAGHNPPILFHDGACRSLQPKGAVIGVLDDGIFSSIMEVEEFSMLPGDILFLYTDGVSETMNLTGEEFGMERIERCISSKHNLKTNEMMDALQMELSSFRGAAKQHDDITVIALKSGDPN